MIVKVVHALDPIHGHLSEIEHTCCQLLKGINSNELSPLDWNPYLRTAMTLRRSADLLGDSLWYHYSHVKGRSIPKLWVKYDVLVRKNRVNKLELLLIYKIFTSTSFSFNLAGETCLTPIRKVYQYGQNYGPNYFTSTSSYLSVLQPRHNIIENLSVWQLRQLVSFNWLVYLDLLALFWF